MARKNRKSKYKKLHEAKLVDYQRYVDKLQVKRERRKERENMSFKEKMEERMEQKGRLKNKTSAPVIGSKIKRDKLAEQFKQMKISRLKLMDKQHATLESMKEQREDDDSDDSDDSKEMEEEEKVEDQDMKEVKTKSKKRGRAYRKMMKSSIKKAAKRPILVKRKMEVD